MAILPKLTDRFDKISIRIPVNSFAKIDKLILKFTYNCRGPRISKTILQKKNKVRRLTLQKMKVYYNAKAVKTVWYRHKDTHTHRRNRTEDREMG